MRLMKRARNWARSMPTHYWGWAFAFLTLGVGWGHAIAFFPPTSYDGVVDLSAVFRMGFTTFVGGIVATIFLFRSRSTHNRSRVRALWFQLVGVILLAGGPLQYLAIQLGYLLADDEMGFLGDRYALAWFAASMLAFLSVRFFILIPNLRSSKVSTKVQGK